jgi:plasmid stabilization system protein ParE
VKTHLLQAAASARLEDIYRHTLQNFGATQADTYLDGLFALFETIADRSVTWRRIPHEFGVEGYYARYRSHFVFWRQAADDEIATVAILHQRMDVARRLREDVSGP